MASDNIDICHRLSGIIAVPAAPFTAGSRLDEHSLRRYARMALGYGVCGFLVPALAAEVYQLSQPERMHMIRIIRDESQGRVAVIGSATAETSEDRKRAVEMISLAGCDGILVFIPYTGEKPYKTEVAAISRMIDGFLMLQDWDFQGPGIPVPVIVELFETIGCFKSLKIEVASAGYKYSQVLEGCRHKIHIAGGWASGQMIEGLDRGVHAYMPTVLHHIYKRIFDLHRTGNRTDAIKLFNAFLPVLSFTRQHPDVSLNFNKRLLRRQGIFETCSVRRHDFPFDQIHQRLTEELIDTALTLAATVEATINT